MKANKVTKFKIRCSKVGLMTFLYVYYEVYKRCPPSIALQYLYTLTVKDSDKADKLKQSLPPGLQRTELPK